MPYKTVKQDCTRSDGTKGSYVLKYKPKKKTSKKKDSEGFVKAGCHTSKKNADGQRAAIEGGPRWIGETKEDKKLETLLRKIERINEAPEAEELKGETISPVNSSKEVGQDWNEADEYDEYDEINEEEAKSTKKYDDNKNLKGKQDELPDHLQKGIIKKADPNDPDLDESDTPHLASYKAPQGSKRDKQLDQTKVDLKKAKDLRKKGEAGKAKELEQRAYSRRDRMERQHREKNEAVLRKAIRNLIREELSKATEDKIRKKAEERGYTYGSMKAEYKKGLAAFASSGSRPGMTAHGWAMARINKCTESQDWSGCKKSKAKKK